MHVQVEERSTGQRSVHVPVVPRIAIDGGGNALERCGLHLARLAALVVFERMAVLRPCADAEAQVEETLRLFRGGHDFPELRGVAAEGFFAEHMLSGGERGARDVGMVRRRDADVNYVDDRIRDQIGRAALRRGGGNQDVGE